MFLYIYIYINFDNGLWDIKGEYIFTERSYLNSIKFRGYLISRLEKSYIL